MFWLEKFKLFRLLKEKVGGRGGWRSKKGPETQRETSQELEHYLEARGRHWEPLQGFKQGQACVLDHTFW